MSNRLVNTTHIQKYVTDRRELATLIQLIYRTSSKVVSKAAVLRRSNGKTGGVYFCTERELRHFLIDDKVFAAIDNYSKHRRGNNVDTDYTRYIDILNNVLKDIKDFGNNIPDTSDEWFKYAENIDHKVHIGKRDPKAILRKKERQTAFIKKFKRVMKW